MCFKRLNRLNSSNNECLVFLSSSAVHGYFCDFYADNNQHKLVMKSNEIRSLGTDREGKHDAINLWRFRIYYYVYFVNAPT